MKLPMARGRGSNINPPNRFSRMIGDKAFGLLMADRLGVAVPRTLVIGRRVAPFEFGQATGSAEVWLRTCPYEPHPGLYTTMQGWTEEGDGEGPPGDALGVGAGDGDGQTTPLIPTTPWMLAVPGFTARKTAERSSCRTSS